VTADLLVAVGRQLGEAAAHDLYLSLVQEPVDRHGERVDWEAIKARIVTGGDQ
jgi:hypothetical protein